MSKKMYIPITPGGTTLPWLADEDINKAWDNLLEDAKHMPYMNKREFQERGYSMATAHGVENEIS